MLFFHEDDPVLPIGMSQSDALSPTRSLSSVRLKMGVAMVTVASPIQVGALIILGLRLVVICKIVFGLFQNRLDVRQTGLKNGRIFGRGCIAQLRDDVIRTTRSEGLFQDRMHLVLFVIEIRNFVGTALQLTY